VSPRRTPPPRKARVVAPLFPRNLVGDNCRFSCEVFTSVSIVKIAVDTLAPVGVTDVGEMLQLACLGAPEQVRLTAWLNPPAGVTLIVDVTLLPLLTVPDVGVRLSAKLGVTAAVTVMSIGAEVDGENVVVPP
jgi:hypothetical protein